jgi:hypothetical protein
MHRVFPVPGKLLPPRRLSDPGDLGAIPALSRVIKKKNVNVIQVLNILSTIRWVYEPVAEPPTSVTKAPTATKKRPKTTKAPSPPAEEAPAAAAPSPPAEETLPAAVADPVTETPTAADGSVDPETSVSLRTDTY